MASSARKPLGMIDTVAPRGRMLRRSITTTRVPGLFRVVRGIGIRAQSHGSDWNMGRRQVCLVGGSSRIPVKGLPTALGDAPYPPALQDAVRKRQARWTTADDTHVRFGKSETP
jgi:hypothetical protein